MTQGTVEFVQVGGYGQIVIRGVEIQLRGGLAEDADKGILQAGRETAVVGALVEIVHQAVELGARSVEWGETFKYLVQRHSYPASVC